MADPFPSAYNFLAPNPDSEYGTILPFAQNAVGSPSWVQDGNNLRFAMPSMARDAMKGWVDAAQGTQTGSLTPDAMSAVTLGSLGAGLMGAPRGALAAGGSFKSYHGSPHDFDRFDTSKIGGGQGAQAFGHGLYFAEEPAVAQSYRDALKKESEGGKMYEVNINADPTQFLDWDKPIGQQPIFPKLPGAGSMPPDVPGSHYYQNYSSPEATSAALQRAGIPGIRYFDQGSRGMGEGSRNTVVFNPEIVDILRKYGMGGLGFNVASQQSQPMGFRVMPREGGY